MIRTTWASVEQYIKNVAAYCEKKGIGTAGVYSLPRGGLIFAVLLSHYMDIPLLAAPCEGCIVIDDIADSGKSLLHYKERGYFITTMHYTRRSRVIPDYYLTETNDWIVYPWEGMKDDGRS